MQFLMKNYLGKMQVVMQAAINIKFKHPPVAGSGCDGEGRRARGGATSLIHRQGRSYPPTVGNKVLQINCY